MSAKHLPKLRGQLAAWPRPSGRAPKNSLLQPARTSCSAGVLGLALCAVAYAAKAAAATIDISPPTTELPYTFVLVSGLIEKNDAEQFRLKTANVSKAIVVFRSDGGNLLPAIQIGRMMRLKNWVTFVPANTTCASSCAIASLGGTRRFADKAARIGFHAAYVTQDGKPSETGAGNARQLRRQTRD